MKKSDRLTKFTSEYTYISYLTTVDVHGIYTALKDKNKNK